MEIRHTHAIHALFRTNIRNTLVRGLEHALIGDGLCDSHKHENH